MADITALLAGIRQERAPAVPWDPAAGGRVSELDRTENGASVPAGDPRPEESAGPPDATAAGLT